MNVCVIGCIFGDKFRIVYPAVKNYDAYFFTNNPEIKEIVEKAGWKYLFVDLPLSDDYATSSLQSKYIKFLQFLKNKEYGFFYKYDKIVYSDHKLEIKDCHIEFLLENISGERGASILVRDHPQPRNNIWEEVGLAMFQERYLRFMPQTIDYIRQKITEGYSEKPYGCDCATTLILYDNRNAKVKKLTDEVYNDLTKLGTPECQIIWAMAGQKYVDIIKVIPWNSMDIRWEEPKKDDEKAQEQEKGQGTFYFDTGKNFNEDEKVRFRLMKDQNNFSYELVLPTNVQFVRFDPVEWCGCFLQNLVITSDTGEVLNYQILNGLKSENNGIVFTTIDPQILIDVKNKGIEKITVQCDIWLFF
jgi:hypothetical protein